MIIFIFLIMVASLMLSTLLKPYFGLRLMGKDISIETYSFAVLIGPILLLISGFSTPGQMIKGITILGSASPLGILVLFLSMVVISIYLDHVGFMEYCARLALNVAKRDGRKLFFTMYILVSALTIFTSNDIVILTITPFIYYFAKHAKINPKPFLIAEFFAANTWSMMLYIGNPTNIFVASAFDIKFMEYTRLMLLPTIAAGLVNIGLLFLIFRKELPNEISYKETKPEEALKDKTGAMLGLAVMVLCIVGLAAAPYLGFEMWPIALSSCIILGLLLVAKDRKKSMHEIGKVFSSVPWSIVPLLLSFFIMVEALNRDGLTSQLAGMFTNHSIPQAILHFGFISAISANFLNNIPMTVAFTSIISNVPQNLLFPSSLAVIIGSNLGANITPIGALAGIMWMNILKRKGYEITFIEFMGYGCLVTIFTLGAALGVLALEMI